MDIEKKESILAAACKTFARFGFKKTAIDEIATAAGVAKGTVYLCCKSKEDLFFQSVNREIRAWIAEIAKQIDPRMHADELLTHCALASLYSLEKRPLVRDLLLGAHDLYLPDWTEQLDELREVGRTVILEILRIGVKQKRFRDDLDLEEVAKIIQDVELTTYIFHNRGNKREARLQARLLVATTMLMEGLRKR